MNLNIIYFIASLVLTFLITVIVLKKLIPKLKSLKMGQTILDIGPRWHKNKEGTPTMGGLSFLLAISLCVLGFGIAAAFTVEGFKTAAFFITYAMAVCYALIGVWDDSLKIKKRENEGFTSGQKFMLQLIIAALYLIAMRSFAGLTTKLYFPYFDVSFELGVFYYIIAVLLIVGIVNSVNLTDGIDGLASSVTAVVGAFFAVASFMVMNIAGGILSACMIGGCLGFLVYNFYPARIFMGDTGSLFLGGLVVGLAFIIDNPLIVLLIGIIYVMESASDIIQVGYYKLTHKRVFKMAPIHHHFEQCGWSEIKIVSVFSVITLIAGAIAFFGILR